MSINRKLAIIWTICLALIVIALSVKLSDSWKEFESLEASTMESSGASIPVDVAVDDSFYSLESSENDKPTSQSSTSVPVKEISPISAKAYLVGNVTTGKIYISQNPSLVLPVASMSKLITAVESLDKMSSSTRVTIREDELGAPDITRFTAGESFTVGELLYPMLLNSSNIAAEALASSTSRAKFMDVMSSYAWEIGMPSTYFADPSGVNPRNISTARDFFALARYLYKYRSDILSVTRTPSIIFATTTDHGHHDFVSIHPFVKEPGFLGGKTGHTPEAKDTMLTILMIRDEPIAIIVLSSNNRRKDTLYLSGEVRKMLK